MSNTAWSRIKYDNDKASINDAVFNLTFNDSLLKKQIYLPSEGYLTNNAHSGSIDIDSQLRGLDTKLAKNPNIWIHKEDTYSQNYNKSDFIYNYSRLNNLLCASRECGINRFTPVCTNPQLNIVNPDVLHLGVNDRNVARDNYKQTKVVYVNGIAQCTQIAPQHRAH